MFEHVLRVSAAGSGTQKSRESPWWRAMSEPLECIGSESNTQIPSERILDEIGTLSTAPGQNRDEKVRMVHS